MTKIYLELDANNYIWGWSSTNEPAMDQVEIEISEDHPFLLTIQLGIYKLVNGTLMLDENVALTNLKDSKKEELKDACSERIAQGFSFDVREKKYWFSFSDSQQKNFEETKILFQNNSIESTIWSCQMEDVLVMLPLNKIEFLTLYLFGILVKKQKLDKLNNKLYTLIDDTSVADEILIINWDSIPDESPPDIPEISEETGEVDLSQVYKVISDLETSDRQQLARIDMNETALLEALDLIFSGAVMGNFLANRSATYSTDDRNGINFNNYANLITIYGSHVLAGDRAIESVPTILLPAVSAYVETQEKP